MARFDKIIIRSPIANDIVDEPIQISGLANAFEATFQARVRDLSGNVLAENFFTAGGSGILRNF
ncbi:MAG: Gmad2 immunoglobulin-like domain-containing protein, partial [Cyanobacteria bacterium J06635_11]